MTRKDLKHINKTYLTTREAKNNPFKNSVELNVIEDTDINKLEVFAANATRKGYLDSKKYSRELGVVIVSSNKLIRKVQGKPNKIISILSQRKVEVGNKAILR